MTLSKEVMHNEFAYNMTVAHVKNHSSWKRKWPVRPARNFAMKRRLHERMSPALLLCHQPRDNDKMFILWSLRAPFHIPLLVGRSMIYWKH